ncbi:uncharacterized protein B0H18DRAFT_1125953 [Fomitopsis serialis]|uniref:uncharacterized protein n=1 Tax=Fomitopsis serialis TaxID=139415 RepID=UPI0020085C1E|nr:uncharacterized protein B0H18DRAFT_1125953 [Neoantrodia serialis]KAH9913865.1 hypothetical protein B0H18DRAFT_1125953 [Neoantrodia serialis]
MRLTAAVLAALTLLCTVFLAQAAPLTLRFQHDATACARLTDCDSCAHTSRCGFSLDTQSCAAKEGHPGSLATSAAQCKRASATLAARTDAAGAARTAARGAASTVAVGAASTVAVSAASTVAVVAAKQVVGQTVTADTLWDGMESHVLNGRPDNVNSGRHLTSTWFAHPAKKGTAGDMDVNDATGLGQVKTGGKSKIKTVWINDNAEGTAVGANKYTQVQVAGICKAALAVLLKTGDSRGSYSVQSPFGGNICVTVSKVQCFPASINPTTVAPGGKC